MPPNVPTVAVSKPFHVRTRQAADVLLGVAARSSVTPVAVGDAPTRYRPPATSITLPASPAKDPDGAENAVVPLVTPSTPERVAVPLFT